MSAYLLPLKEVARLLTCYCGMQFKPGNHPQARYCSDECYAKRPRPQVSRSCAHCSVAFECGATSHKRYCTSECAVKGRTVLSVKCLACGTVYSTLTKLKLYCTSKCRDRFRDLTRKQKIVRTCKNCGTRYPRAGARDRKQFCSAACRAAAAAQSYSRWASGESRRRSSRRHHLKKSFGITPEAWDALFESQGKACACCRATRASKKSPNKWHTDHDHETHRFRGILCQRCNTTLGKLGDTPTRVAEMCKRLLDYLHSGATHVQ